MKIKKVRSTIKKVKVASIRFTLKYSVYAAISACTHRCDTNTITQSHNVSIANKNP